MDQVVREGIRMDPEGNRMERGMVAFKKEITPSDLEKIRAYIVHRANQDKQAGGEPVEGPAGAKH
jgi:hypothetical protein